VAKTALRRASKATVLELKIDFDGFLENIHANQRNLHIMNETSPPPVPAGTKTSALAIWSLVLGILSFVCFFWFLASVPAIICGHLSLSRINRSGGMLKGQGLAIGGLIAGYLNIVLFSLLALIAVPNFIKAREVALRHGCINNMRLIENAKQQWAADKEKKTTDVPTENDLATYLPKGMPHCPAGGTYVIHAVGEDPTCSIPGHEVPK